jgi:hypothetical protein
MTQDLMANMLGVRREGVTEAAGRLQKLGIISYQRGRIVVLERKATASCGANPHNAKDLISVTSRTPRPAMDRGNNTTA